MPTCGRKTYKKINKTALLHNAQVLKNHIGHSKLLAMVKSDAYGHGIQTVVPTLFDVVDGFGVAILSEALQVAQAIKDTIATKDSIITKDNITAKDNIATQTKQKPIVIAQGVFDKDEWQLAIDNHFSVVIHQPIQLDLALQIRPTPNNPTNTIWLKYNTGMNRLGFDELSIKHAAKQLHQAGYRIILMSHFACSDDKNHPKNAQQITAFKKMQDELQSFDVQASLCNSAGIFHFKACHYDWVRAGIALYGASPVADKTAQAFNLCPVMTLSSQIMAIHQLKAGQSVGYGSTWIAPKDSTIGVVAIGYGDGYPRDGQNGYVLINSHKAPIVGRIAMDMLVVDLTHICANIASTVTIGDTVTLFGVDEMGNMLPAEVVARYANTISYEIFCQISQRPVCVII